MSLKKTLVLTALLISTSCYAKVSSEDIKNFLTDYFARTLMFEEDRYEPGIVLGSVDSRLTLPTCQQDIEIASKNPDPTATRATYQVLCPAPYWVVHVPVTFKRYDDVVVADHPIARGERITAHDLKVVKREIQGLQGRYYRSLEDIQEVVARRGLVTDQVITSAHVQPERIIRKGQQIDIVYQAEGLSVRARGRALEDGARGDRIQVENTRSKRRLEAYVNSAQDVKVYAS